MVNNRIDALEELRKQLAGADVDLLQEMVKVFTERLMGADADAVPLRVNSAGEPQPDPHRSLCATKRRRVAAALSAAVTW